MLRDFQLTAFPAIVAFLVSMVVAPFVIRALRRLKLGQTIQKDGPESHFSKAGTPTMGGVIILAGLLAGVLATFGLFDRSFADIVESSTKFRPEHLLRSAIGVIVFACCYAALGLVDDYLTIKPIKGVRGIASKPKALLQFLLAAGFVYWLNGGTWSSGVLYIAGHTILQGIPYTVFQVLFLTGMANFVNITDGLDGLVSGLTATAVIAFAVSTFTGAVSVYNYAPHLPMLPLLMALFGACIAFLWFNANPARVFMGDTGSLLIGALLPAVALVTRTEVLMTVICLVFVLDGFSTIIQWAVFKFTRITTGTGRRVFLKSPVHHHFEMAGWPEQTVVVRFWICGVIAAVLGYAGVTLRWW